MKYWLEDRFPLRQLALASDPGGTRGRIDRPDLPFWQRSNGLRRIGPAQFQDQEILGKAPQTWGAFVVSEPKP